MIQLFWKEHCSTAALLELDKLVSSLDPKPHPSPLASVIQWDAASCGIHLFQFETGLVGAWRNGLLESVRGSSLLESQDVLKPSEAHGTGECLIKIHFSSARAARAHQFLTRISWGTARQAKQLDS